MHIGAGSGEITKKTAIFRSKTAVFLLIPALFWSFSGQLKAQETPTIAIHLDPASTTIHWTLDSLLHTQRGTFKLKGGDVVVNAQTGLAQGEILIDATTGSGGNAARDARWQRDILESTTYPSIIFHPTKVEGLKGIDGTQQAKATGTMTLHGKDHPIEMSLSVQLQGKDVMVTGHFMVPYVEWGLKQATAGMVRYDKQVAIDISAKGAVVKEKAKASADYQ